MLLGLLAWYGLLAWGMALALDRRRALRPRGQAGAAMGGDE
jgi:hypothetical protein